MIQTNTTIEAFLNKNPIIKNLLKKFSKQFNTEVKVFWIEENKKDEETTLIVIEGELNTPENSPLNETIKIKFFFELLKENPKYNEIIDRAYAIGDLKINGINLTENRKILWKYDKNKETWLKATIDFEIKEEMPL